MKTCKNCIYSRKIIPKNTNCPFEFVCSLSDEDFHDCISNDMWRFSSKVLDQAMEDDAKQASIPYSYVENDVNMREAYEAGYEKAKKEYEKTQGRWIPVSERLPDKDGCYLVTLEGVEDCELVDNVDIAKFIFSEKDDCNNGFQKAYIVTAWQSLPEPYNEGGVEE